MKRRHIISVGTCSLSILSLVGCLGNENGISNNNPCPEPPKDSISIEYEKEMFEKISTIGKDGTDIYLIDEYVDIKPLGLDDTRGFIKETDFEEHDLVVFQAELLSGSSTIENLNLVTENDSGHVYACAKAPEDGTGNTVYNVYLFRIASDEITSINYTYRRDDGEVLSTQ